MRALLLLMSLLVSQSVLAECSTEVDEHGSMSKFKAQLQCFADDNSRLKAESYKLATTPPPQLYITSRTWASKGKNYDGEKCMTEAFLEMNSRSGKMLEHHSRVLSFSADNYSASIGCDSANDVGEVIVTSSDRNKIDDLAERLARSVFDAAIH